MTGSMYRWYTGSVSEIGFLPSPSVSLKVSRLLLQRTGMSLLLPPIKQKAIARFWMDLSPTVRHRALFGLSTVLGTAVFFILFECLHYLIVICELFRQHLAFSVAYVLSYIISILWQHSLNRLLLPRRSKSDHYCHTLGHTFAAYCLSLVLSAMLGMFLLAVTGMQKRLIGLITLMIGGSCNYKLLQLFDRQSTSLIEHRKCTELV